MKFILYSPSACISFESRVYVGSQAYERQDLLCSVNKSLVLYIFSNLISDMLDVQSLTIQMLENNFILRLKSFEAPAPDTSSLSYSYTKNGTLQYWSLLNWRKIRFRCSSGKLKFCCYFTMFKNVVHSLKPCETPRYSASRQDSNYVQHS